MPFVDDVSDEFHRFIDGVIYDIIKFNAEALWWFVKPPMSPSTGRGLASLSVGYGCWGWCFRLWLKGLEKSA